MNANQFWQEKLGKPFNAEDSFIGKEKTLGEVQSHLQSLQDKYDMFIIVGDDPNADGVILQDVGDFNVYIMGVGPKWEASERVILTNGPDAKEKFENMHNGEKVLFMFDVDKTLTDSPGITKKLFERSYQMICHQWEIEPEFSGADISRFHQLGIHRTGQNIMRNYDISLFTSAIASYIGESLDKVVEAMNQTTVPDYFDSLVIFDVDVAHSITAAASLIRQKDEENQKFFLASIPYVGECIAEFRKGMSKEFAVENVEPHLKKEIVGGFKTLITSGDYEIALFTKNPAPAIWIN